MPSFSDLEQRILRFLKEEYLEKGSRPSHLNAPATLHRDVMAKFGLDLSGYREVIARLESFGIVEAPTIEAHNGCLHIDPTIVQVVHQLDHPTEVSGSGVTNAIFVQEMNQSVIQQGNVGSNQDVRFGEADAEALAGLIAEVRKILPELGLGHEDAQVVVEDVDTIERQVRSPRPKRSVVKECLTSLRTIMEGAAGGAASTGVVEAITAILGSL